MSVTLLHDCCFAAQCLPHRTTLAQCNLGTSLELHEMLSNVSYDVKFDELAGMYAPSVSGVSVATLATSDG